VGGQTRRLESRYRRR